MAFEMVSQPAVMPFAPAAPIPQMKPASVPAFAPTAHGAPLAAAPTMARPTEQTKKYDFLRPVVSLLDNIRKEDEAEVRRLAASGIQPAGKYIPPATERAATDPNGTFESANIDVNTAIEQLRQVHGEDVPDDLTKQEKGMLLMQLGFGILAGGPGLGPALGQAGLGMMGAWNDMRREKKAEGTAARRDKMAVAGRELDVALHREDAATEAAQRKVELEGRQALSREEMASRAALAREEMAGRQALSREEMAARQRLLNTEMSRPYTDIGQINADVSAGRMTPEQGQRAIEVAFTSGAAGGGRPPADVETAQTVGTWRASMEGRKPAPQDYLAAYDQLREAKTDPLKRTAMIVDLVEAQMSNPVNAAKDPKMLQEQATQIVDSAIAAANAQPGGQVQQVEGQGIMPSQSAAAAVPRETASFTAPMPPLPAPAIGTVDEGMRFKGGDPSKPENWEPAS